MTEHQERRQTVGIFGHVGHLNLGDEASFAALIEAVKVRRPQAEIVGFSANPQDTKHRYGIMCFPIWRESASKVTKSTDGKTVPQSGVAHRGSSLLKRAIKMIPGLYPCIKTGCRFLAMIPEVAQEVLFLWQSHRILRRVDLIAVAGSQHFNDYIVGPWNFSYTVFKWTMLAKLAGAKVAFINVGAGPLLTPLGKWFIKRAVKWSDFQSYRDETSICCIQRLGLKVIRPAVPDMVFSLPLEERQPLTNAVRASLVVGVNPIPFNSADYWIGASPEIYQRYIRIMAGFVGWLVSRGCKVVFFPTQLSLDPAVIGDIRSHLAKGGYSLDNIDEASLKSLEDLCVRTS